MPPVTVKPAEPVNSPAEVMVPEPVVEILPVVEIEILEAKSPPTTELNVGSPEALPCKTVVVVPAKVPSTPAAVLVTTPAVVRPESVIEVLAERVVKAPVEAVPDPIGPGAAKVAPFKELAFRLATLVVEATTNGAVPVDKVDVSWPLRLMVVIPDRAPALIIRLLMVLVEVGPLKAPAEVIVPVPAVAKVTLEARVTADPVSVIEESPTALADVNLAMRLVVPDTEPPLKAVQVLVAVQPLKVVSVPLK